MGNIKSIESVRELRPGAYPLNFETLISEDDVRLYYKVHRRDSVFGTMKRMTMEKYFARFPSNPAKYDVHEGNFQDFALREYRGMSAIQRREFGNSMDNAQTRLIRAAVYAIAARDDIGWNGEVLETDAEREQKRAEIESYWKQCRLYDWTRMDARHMEVDERIQAIRGLGDDVDEGLEVADATTSGGDEGEEFSCGDVSVPTTAGEGRLRVDGDRGREEGEEEEGEVEEGRAQTEEGRVEEEGGEEEGGEERGEEEGGEEEGGEEGGHQIDTTESESTPTKGEDSGSSTAMEEDAPGESTGSSDAAKDGSGIDGVSGSDHDEEDEQQQGEAAGECDVPELEAAPNAHDATRGSPDAAPSSTPDTTASPPDDEAMRADAAVPSSLGEQPKDQHNEKTDLAEEELERAVGSAEVAREGEQERQETGVAEKDDDSEASSDSFDDVRRIGAHEHLPIWVTCDDTQTTVEKASRRHPGRRIAWLNLANAHHCGGVYHARSGSQEEHVASVCNGLFTLGFNADLVTNAKDFFTGGISYGVWYRNGRHIPPGGNYFTPVRFITSSPQIECFMIAAAFADFRMYVPVFLPNSERSLFYTLTGEVRDQGLLEERLMLDMHGVLKTAVLNHIDVLVLGASGCGAFQHDARLEARLWGRVLEEYEGCFKEVVFSILPDHRHPENVHAFAQEFTDKPPAQFDEHSWPDYI